MRSKRPRVTASTVRRWRGEPTRRPPTCIGGLRCSLAGGKVVAFSVFAQVLLPILVVVGSGYLLQRRVKLEIHSVNRLSLYLLSPALIFASLVRSQIGATETLRIGAFMVLFILCIGLVTCFLSGFWRLATADTAALRLSVLSWTAG